MRTVTYAAPDGKLHEGLGIVEFVLMRTILDLGDPDAPAELIAGASRGVVEHCLDEGWFTQGEWAEAWMNEQVLGLDQELTEVLREEMS